MPHVSLLHVGSLNLTYAEEFEALLRAGRSAPCYVQLLPSTAVAKNNSSAKRVRAGAGGNSGETSVSVGGVRGDAGACASSDQRTGEGYTFADFESAEAAGVEGFVEKEGARNVSAVAYAIPG